MKTLGLPLGLLAIALVGITAAGAGASEYLVPPSNSAATQYTEAYPTAGGAKDAKGSRPKRRAPGAVLGSRSARRLDAQGPDGEATAAVAAETAPESAVPARAPAGAQRPDGSRRHRAAKQGGPSTTPGAQAAEGSSGLAAALGQATGSSSSGDLGLLLPLLILAAAAWATAYWIRQRRAT